MGINNTPKVSSGILEITLKVNPVLVSRLVFGLCGINCINIRETPLASVERMTWEFSVFRSSE